MEKTKKSKISIFSFLPKTASFSFSSQTFSPGREKRQENLNKFKANTGKGFSGPIVSIIPAEARRKPKNGSFDDQEPTSPKVSCMGQVKQKKRICKANCNSPPKREKKQSFKIGRMFRPAKRVHKSDADIGTSPGPAPSLCQLRRFSSGRNAFADFDWKAAGGAVSSHRGYYSDDDRGDDDDDDDNDDFAIPHSAPLRMGGGVSFGPRNELNIWKRRTVDPPKPLELIEKAKEI